MDQTWTWIRDQQSRVHSVEMNYLREACGVTRWECESNERVYEKCGMVACASGMECEVLE